MNAGTLDASAGSAGAGATTGSGGSPGAGGAGGGGSGGTTSGSGGQAPDGPIGDYSWLFDPDVWQTIPIPESTCEIFQADVTKLRWPGHDWQPCGPGCRKAEACPGGAPYWVPTAGTAVRVLDGQAFLSLSFNVLAREPAVMVSGIFELDSSRPRVLLQTRDPSCMVRLAGPASPFLFELLATTGPFRLWPGLATIDDGSVTWAAPPLDTGLASFDFVTGWGGVFGFSSVGFTTDSTTTALSLAYTGPFIQRPASSGDEIFLPEWRGDEGAILSLKPGQGIRTVVEGSWSPATVAASARWIAWLGVHGPRAFDGRFDQAEIYWSPRAFDASDGAAEVIPGVPVLGLPQGFWTAGDFVGLGDCSDDCRILVADLRTRKLWKIPAPSGHVMHAVGMTDTELIAGERVDQSQRAWFQTLYRYDLTRLAEYAVEL